MKYYDPSGHAPSCAAMGEWAGALSECNAPRPAQVFQVDLHNYNKRNQYEYPYGANNCGLMAVAQPANDDAYFMKIMGVLYEAAKENKSDGKTAADGYYSENTGMQPSILTNAAKKVFGSDMVAARDNQSIGDLRMYLEKGYIVIVDIQVGTYENNGENPTTSGAGFAHFARVVAIDRDSVNIYVDNTLRGAEYWVISKDLFLTVWQYPEKYRPTDGVNKGKIEPISNWILLIDPQAYSKMGGH